ncbi:DUF4136 domain-containing protein [Aquimarina sp. U1-2]|uniref:DUF4136 domain-containing protein n=1 Tax=Aquimarina sp. U1-2 TaxID=2823141 RepID=UPI001AECBF4D|nr:DUF4136 domain-containing protein [Aquimarina sp. U1-2]
MKQLILVLAVILVCSCGTTNVVYDYDEQQDFSKYKTYAFFPDMNSGLSDIDQKRLISVTEAAMNSKGFTRSDIPDIFLNFETVFSKQASNNNLGVGLGGGGGGGINVGVGGNIPIGGPLTYLELTLDFVDVKNDALVWQAITRKRFYPNATPEKRRMFFQKVIEKALVKYPPQQK